MLSNWYVLQVYSNFEDKVADAIHEHIEQESDIIHDVFVPYEIIKVTKNGKLYDQKRKLHPGYVYIKCILNDDLYKILKKIPKVSGFLTSVKGGASGRAKPITISNKEIENIKQLVHDQKQKVSDNIVFFVGQKIDVIDGPFQSFRGIVEEVDSEKEKLKVSVSIFNRDTPVELEYRQVKKSDNI